MRLKKSEYYGLGLNVLLTSIYVWYLFRTLWMAPAHTLLSAGGDGTKNYYTYLYHIMFGKGWHFDGMNYPWGEHISFTDNQPILAYPLSYLQEVFHCSYNDLLGIMNLLFPLLFIASSAILYRFFIKAGVHVYVSAVFGLLLTFMAPNFYRLFGHFGLSYTFNIGLTIYWLFRYRETHQKRYLIALGLLNIGMAFIHMYNLLLGMMMLLFYIIAALFFENDSLKQKLSHAIKMGAVIVLSFGVVKLIFFFTDTIPDRPQHPWGILTYVSSLRQFFTTEYSHLGKTFSLLFNGFYTTQLDEGYAYIGLVPLAYFVFLLCNGMFYFIKQKNIHFYQPISIHEKYLLVMGACSFLLAIGFPFVHGFASLLDYIPAIKQFRSLGRFSIITYFCFGMACIIRIGIVVHAFVTNRKFSALFYFLLSIMFLWSIEIFSYSKYTQHRIDESDDNYSHFFRYFSNTAELKVEADSQYQCIMGFPLFCIGSEKVGRDVDSDFSSDLFSLSLHKGLPLVNTQLSRSSWKQSFQLMRLAGGIFTDKSFFTSSLPNHKKILLVRLKEAYLTQEEKSIFPLCDSIGEQDRLVFYQLDWDKLMQYESKMKDSLNALPIQSFNQTNQDVYAKQYEDQSTSSPFMGKGALDIQQAQQIVLFDTIFQPHAKTSYEFSVWSLIQSHDYRMPYCSIELLDKAGTIVLSKNAHAQQATDQIDFWFRIATEVDIDTNVYQVRIVYHNEDAQPGRFIDAFLFKPLDAFVAEEAYDKKYRLYNNHRITLNSN